MKYSLRKKIKIKRATLNKFIKIIICLGMLLTISVFYTPVRGVKSVSSFRTFEYTILKGDDIWSIAEKINSKDMDTREVVYEIKRINKMDDSALIKVGQHLILPIY